MNGEEKKKFAFHCGVIDKLFGQMDLMANWNECLLENFYEKVTRSLQVLDQFDTFFEDYNEYFAYIDKGSQVQVKLKSLQTNNSSRLVTDKSESNKVASEPSVPNLEKNTSLQAKDKTVLKAEENAPSSPSKKIVDYSKIPDTDYKLLIDGPVSQKQPKENNLPVKDTSPVDIAVGLSKLELSLAQEANAQSTSSMSKKNKKIKNNGKPNDPQSPDSLDKTNNIEKPSLVSKETDSTVQSNSLASKSNQNKSPTSSKVVPPSNRPNPKQVYNKFNNNPHTANFPGAFPNKHPNFSFNRPFLPVTPQWNEKFSHSMNCCCQQKFDPQSQHRPFIVRGHNNNRKRGNFNFQPRGPYANHRPSFNQVPNNGNSSSNNIDKKMTTDQKK